MHTKIGYNRGNEIRYMVCSLKKTWGSCEIAHLLSSLKAKLFLEKQAKIALFISDSAVI